VARIIASVSLENDPRESETREIQVAISRTEAEEELSKFIKNKGFPEYYSKQWLKDLLNII